MKKQKIRRLLNSEEEILEHELITKEWNDEGKLLYESEKWTSSL